MRRTLLSVIAVLILLCQGAQAAEVETSAVCAVLMDAATGRVLSEKNAHEPRLIASITKLMTALVAVELHPELSDVVKIENEWLAGAEGSSIYLRAGEEMTLETLLYGMLLESGNDAAQAVAWYCGGDMETFVDLMNLRAYELGMKDSQFQNPSGLNADGHYSTAYDMALCAMACMNNETIAKIVATKSATFGARTFVNHNKLLRMYDGCIGMKTGYTELAGRTLVSCAERDGHRLIAVTLSAPDDWNDHMALYDYGFSTYSLKELCQEGQLYRRIPVTGSLVRFVGVAPVMTVKYPLTDSETIETVVQLPETVEAPVVAGSIAGQIDFYLNGKLAASSYLVYTQNARYNLYTQQSLMDRALEFIQGKTAMARLFFLESEH